MSRPPFTPRISRDPPADLRCAVGITGYAFGVVVPADPPLTTWGDLVNWARANPGKRNCGSASVLTRPHPVMEDIAQRETTTRERALVEKRGLLRQN